ncbi:MAG: hypothetical protein FWC54_00640 [Actinomycetia bacterium]|nr:hypothetical protein [Actinomycetes bacterium]
MANEVNGSEPVVPAPSPAPPVAYPPTQPYGVHPAVIHQPQAFYQKVWFWVVLAVAMLVISIVGTVAGSYIYRAMNGGAMRTFPGGNGTMMRNFNGGSGGAPNFNGNGGSGSSGGGNVVQ